VLAAGGTIDLVLVGTLKLVEPYLSIWNMRNVTQAWVVPTTAPDLTQAQLSGVRIEALGYSIETPWSGPPVIYTGTTFTSVKFEQEGAFLILGYPFIGAGRAQSSKAMPSFTGASNVQSGRSNYATMAAAMAATPRDAAWWKTPGENRRILEPLILKLFAVPDLNAIYNLSGPEMRGFQLESKSLSRRRAQLKLFDSADRQLDIEIVNGIGDKPVLTQQQINAMVASIRIEKKK